MSKRSLGMALAATGIIVAACGGRTTESSSDVQTEKLSASKQIVFAIGSAKVEGVDTIVEIVVQVPAGPGAEKAAKRVLRAHGVTPAPSAIEGGYSFTGLEWDSFPVVQHYNSANEPVGIQATLNAQASWTNVPTSFADLQNGASTDRCPSLVQECSGPQRYNGANEIAWLTLDDPNVLGVTWSGSHPKKGTEADVGMNTSFKWTDDLATAQAAAGPGGSMDVIDAETVLLHEFGHVLGLGHSDDDDAVMAPYYFPRGPIRDLQADDIAGISALYDAGCSDDSQCDDGNPCTDDACSGGACTSSNNSNPCDDGDSCTTNDVCSGGSCGGSPLCGAGEICTDGVCETAAVCGDANCESSKGESCGDCPADCGECPLSAQCEACSSDADCVDGARCFMTVSEQQAGGQNTCHMSCSRDSDCEAGYSCVRVTGGYKKRCLYCF